MGGAAETQWGDAAGAEVGVLSAGDGVKLHRVLHLATNPRGVVWLLHGLGEHTGRYENVVQSCLNAGLHVVRFDLRGHGRSAGHRGHSPSFSQMMDDLTRMSQWVRSRFPQLPVIAYAHSLGGNLMVNWRLRQAGGADVPIAYVISAPWFLLADRPPRWKVAAVRSLARLFPSLPIPARFRTRNLTRSQLEQRKYESDPLVHRRISVRMTIDAFDAALWALEQAPNFPEPVLGIHGGADPITDPRGTELFCQRAPKGQYVLFRELVHEPHHDPEWPAVMKVVTDWIDEQLEKHQANSNGQLQPAAPPTC